MESTASPAASTSSTSSDLPVPDADVSSLSSLSSFQLRSILRESEEYVALLGDFPPSLSPAVMAIKPPRLTGASIVDALPSCAVTLRHSNSIYHSFSSALLPCHIDVTYPAPATLIARLSSTASSVLVTETGDDYRAVHVPHTAGLLSQPAHLQWVWNLLLGKSEANRVVHHQTEGDARFVLVAHPEWDMAGVGRLHCLAIVDDRSLHSLRDLTAAHLPMLSALRQSVARALHARLGVEESALQFFFHYPPSYYQLHVHVLHVDVNAGFTFAVGKAIELHDVEQQLRRDSAWYAHCSMRCRVHREHPLAVLAHPRPT